MRTFHARIHLFMLAIMLIGMILPPVRLTAATLSNASPIAASGAPPNAAYAKIGTINTDSGRPGGDGVCDILWIPPGASVFYNETTVRDFASHIAYDGYYWRNGDGAQVKFFENLDAPDQVWVSIAGSTVNYPGFSKPLGANDDINDLFENLTSEKNPDADYTVMVKMALKYAADNKGMINKRVSFTGHSQGANVAQLLMLEMFLNDPVMRERYPKAFEDTPAAGFPSHFPRWLINHRYKNINFGQSMQWAGNHMAGGLMFGTRPHWLLHKINRFSVRDDQRTAFVNESTDVVPAMFSITTFSEWPSAALGLDGVLGTIEAGLELKLPALRATLGEANRARAVALARSHIVFDDQTRDTASAHGQSFLDTRLGLSVPARVYRGALPNNALLRDYTPAGSVGSSGALRLKYLGGAGFDCRSAKIYEQRTDRPPWHADNCVPRGNGMAKVGPPTYELKSNAAVRKPDGIPDTMWVNPDVKSGQVGRESDPKIVSKQAAIVLYWADILGAPDGPNDRNPFGDARNDDLRKRPLEQRNRGLDAFGISGEVFGIVQNREFIINKVYDAQGNLTAFEQINPAVDCPGGPGGRIPPIRRYPNGHPDDYQAPWTFPTADSIQRSDPEGAFLNSLVPDTRFDAWSSGWSSDVRIALNQRILTAQNLDLPAALAHYRYMSALVNYRQSVAPEQIMNTAALATLYDQATVQSASLMQQFEDELSSGLRAGAPAAAPAIIAYWTDRMRTDPAIAAWNAQPLARQWDSDLAPLRAALQDLREREAQLGERGLRQQTAQQQLAVERAIASGGGVGVLRGGLDMWTTNTLSFVGVPSALIDPTSTAPQNAPGVLIVPSGALESYQSFAWMRDWLASYAASGGTLVVLAQAFGRDWEVLPGGEVRGLGFEEDILCREESVDIVGASPYLAGLRRDRPDIQLDGSFTQYPAAARVLLMRRTGNQMPAMIQYPFGAGKVVATSIYADFSVINGMQSREDMPFARSFFLQLWREATGASLAGTTTPGVPLTLTVNVQNTTASPLTEVKVSTDVAAGTDPDIWRYRAHYAAEGQQTIALDPPLAPGQSRQASVTLPPVATSGLHRLGIQGIPGELYLVESPFVYDSSIQLQLGREYDSYWIGEQAVISGTIVPAPALTAPTAVIIRERNGAFAPIYRVVQPGTPLRFEQRVPVTAAVLGRALDVEVQRQSNNLRMANAKLPLPAAPPADLAFSAPSVVTGATLPFTITNVGGQDTTYSGRVMLRDHRGYLLQTLDVSGQLGHTGRNGESPRQRSTLTLPGNQAAGRYMLAYSLYSTADQHWEGGLPVDLPGVRLTFTTETTLPIYEPDQTVTATSRMVANQSLAGGWLRLEVLKRFMAGGDITRLAGGVRGSDGVGRDAHIGADSGLAVSADGDFALIADTYNETIRYLDLRTNEMNTIAGSLRTHNYYSFSYEYGTTFRDGVGDSAILYRPRAVAISADGTFALIGDSNVIRRLDLRTRRVTTLAGDPTRVDCPDGCIMGGGYADGVGRQALFNEPTAIAISADGSFALISEKYNPMVRRLDLTNLEVTTVAGAPSQQGSSDGVGAAARFGGLGLGLSISADGSYALVADRSNYTIRRIDLATRAVTTIAGLAGTSGTADGSGAAARFSSPQDIAINSAGTFALITDADRVVRRLDLTTGQVTTPIGNRTPPYPCVDTDGAGNAAVFCSVGDMAMSRDGRVALATNSSMEIRRIGVASAVVATIAGERYDLNRAANTTDNRFETIGGIAIAPDGISALMVADDMLWQIDLTSDRRTVLAGQFYRTGSNTPCQLVNGAGAAVRFCQPSGIAISPDGTYALIADSRNQVVRRYDMVSGQVTTYAGSAYPFSGTWQCQNIDGVGAAARFCLPYHIRISNDGTFAVLVDVHNNNVRKIDLQSAQVTLVAGGGTTYGGADGIGAAASFGYPSGLAISPDNTFVLVADTNNNKIRRVELATQAVTTLTLSGPTVRSPSDIVMSSDPRFALVLDSSGYTDGGGYLRRIDLQSNTLTTINSYFSASDGRLDVSRDGGLVLFTSAGYGSNTGIHGDSLHRLEYAATLRERWLPLTGASSQTIAHALANPALATDPRARGELILRASVYGAQRTEEITKGRQLLATAESPFLMLADSAAPPVLGRRASTATATGGSLILMAKRRVYRPNETLVLYGRVQNGTSQTGITLAISDNGVALPAVSLPTLAPGRSALFTATIPLASVGYHRIQVAAPDGAAASTRVEVFAPALSADALRGPTTVQPGHTAAYSLTLRNDSLVPAIATIQLAQAAPLTLTIDSLTTITPTLALAVPAAAPPLWAVPLTLGGDLDEERTLALNIRTAGTADLAPDGVQVGVERPGPVISATASLPAPLPIPDDTAAGIRIPLLITTTAAISDVNVLVAATHGSNSDLRMTLISPQGTRVDLANRTLNGQDLAGTIFDDQGAAFGSGPYAGRFRPSQPLRALRDESLAGVWLLEVADASGYHGDIGRVLGWGLEVTTLAVDPAASVVAGQSVRVIAPLEVLRKGQAVATIEGFETTAHRPLDVQTTAGAVASAVLPIPSTLVGGTYPVTVRVGGRTVSTPVTIRNWTARLALAVPGTSVAHGATFMATVRITETAGIGGAATLFVRYHGGEVTRTLTLLPNGAQEAAVPLVANAAAGRVSVALSARPSMSDDPAYTPIIDSRPLNVAAFPAHVDLATPQVSSGMTLSGALVITAPISAASLRLPAALGGDLLWHASEVTTTLPLHQRDRLINLTQTRTGRWPFAVPLPADLPAGRYSLLLTVNGVPQPVQVDVRGPQIVVHRTDIVERVDSTASHTLTLGLDVESTTALPATIRAFYGGMEIPLGVSAPLPLAAGRQSVQIRPVVPAWLLGSGQLDVVFTTASGQPIGGTQLPVQFHAATLVRADLLGATQGGPLEVVSTVVGRGPATLAVSSPTAVLASVPLDLNGYETISTPLTLPATTRVLTVTLTDRYGKQEHWPLAVDLLVPDRTPPQITITQPTGAYATSSLAAVVVSGTASDTAGLERVTVNGMAADLDPVTGSYSATLLLPPGTHPIQAVAQDRGGNQATSGLVSAQVTWVAPTLRVPPLLSAAESQGTISLTLTLETPSILSGTLRLRSSGGTATAGQDYEALDTTLTIRPYQTEVVVPLTLRNDTQAEGDERITVLLSDAVNLQLPATSMTVVITDDEGGALHTTFMPMVVR